MEHNRGAKDNLEDPARWDLDTPVKYDRPRTPGRALVSVPFRRDEFERVTLGAERAGEKLSVFVRRAALDKADGIIRADIHCLTYSQPGANVILIPKGASTVFSITGSEKSAASHQKFEALEALAAQ